MSRPRTERRRTPPSREEKKLQRIAGWPAVAALFRAAPERIDRLYYVEALKGEAGEMCIALAKRHRPYRIVKGDELARIAGTAMHGGILALAEPQAVTDLDTAEAGRWAEAGEPLLMLDGVGNPHNLGAIARTAAFFGLRRLVLSDHPGQALPSDASHRVAEGGLEQLSLYRLRRFADGLRRLSKSYRIIGAALEGGRAPAELSRGRPIALVLGNEEQGLPRSTLERCEAIVTLPGPGAVQSLNVGAAAAILIYALLAAGDAKAGTPDPRSQ